jgi:predicted nuclease of restriction endonuclease-like RecB superfamily
MLTADLAQSWQRGGRTGPRYIETEDASYLQEATDLIGLFKEHHGHARALLEQALEEYVGTGTDYRILRGLIKLLMDRCAFETACGVADPAEIRRVLFLKARQHHPVTGHETARAEVVTEVARELNCAPEVLMDGLYADLPENQKLIDFEALGARELLDRYNVAQAQALLYRCVEMRLMIEPQDPAGYRELFGAIKAYRLIHTIKGNAATGYEVRLDGPVSMFHRSQKYGVQMAVFLPALLTCKGWRMRAEIVSKKSGRAFFELNSKQTQLRSHYLSVPPYENPVLERLETAWARFDTSWSLEPGREVVDLGEGAFIPDFIIRHHEGRQVYLEVLGFWTPQHLKERLEEFEHGRVRNFIIAAWDELRGSREPPGKLPPNVILFKRGLDPAAVELVLDKLVSDEQ